MPSFDLVNSIINKSPHQFEYSSPREGFRSTVATAPTLPGAIGIRSGTHAYLPLVRFVGSHYTSNAVAQLCKICCTVISTRQHDKHGKHVFGTNRLFDCNGCLDGVPKRKVCITFNCGSSDFLPVTDCKVTTRRRKEKMTIKLLTEETPR